MMTPYHVRSSVSSDSLSQFVRAIQGSIPPITAENISDLTLLADEFGFAALASRLADAQSELSMAPQDRILRRQDAQQGEIDELRAANSAQQSEMERMNAEIAALRSDGRVPALERQVAALQSEVESMRERHGAEIGRIAEDNRALTELTTKMSQALAVLQHQLATMRSEITAMQAGEAAEKAERSEEEEMESSENEEEDEEGAAGAKDTAERHETSGGSSEPSSESDSESESSSSETTSESS
jgi:hypothetical protein